MLSSCQVMTALSLVGNIVAVRRRQSHRPAFKYCKRVACYHKRVSWISTEAPDRYNEVVIAKGMNDSQFALNPIVTLNHDYSMPPIGRSLWRKLAKEGNQRGIQAKTVYPPRPDGWTDPGRRTTSSPWSRRAC